MNNLIHIYRARRGKYLKPVPFPTVGFSFQSERYPCEHPNHWKWGNGTRNGQKLYYPTNEMFFQKYHLTKKEAYAAIDEYDMASLETPSRIICKNCADKLAE